LDIFGAFFDWADAKFDMAGVAHQDLDEDSDCDAENKLHVAPAKLLAFYADTTICPSFFEKQMETVVQLSQKKGLA
jgi:hypothetical protein